MNGLKLFLCVFVCPVASVGLMHAAAEAEYASALEQTLHEGIDFETIQSAIELARRTGNRELHEQLIDSAADDIANGDIKLSNNKRFGEKRKFTTDEVEEILKPVLTWAIESGDRELIKAVTDSLMSSYY